jgi:hypothetical protein
MSVSFPFDPGIIREINLPKQNLSQISVEGGGVIICDALTTKADTLSRMFSNKKNNYFWFEPKRSYTQTVSVVFRFFCFLYQTIFRTCIETTETNITVKDLL